MLVALEEQENLFLTLIQGDLPIAQGGNDFGEALLDQGLQVLVALEMCCGLFRVLHRCGWIETELGFEPLGDRLERFADDRPEAGQERGADTSTPPCAAPNSDALAIGRNHVALATARAGFLRQPPRSSADDRSRDEPFQMSFTKYFRWPNRKRLSVRFVTSGVSLVRSR